MIHFEPTISFGSIITAVTVGGFGWKLNQTFSTIDKRLSRLEDVKDVWLPRVERLYEADLQEKAVTKELRHGQA